MRWLTWITATTFAVALICALPARAQQNLDATKVDPAHHTVEFENDQVRVVRFKLAPGEQSARHSHPDSVVVVLTAGSVENTTDDGKTATRQAKAGDAFWVPAVTHVTRNVGNGPIDGILVELKNPHSARPAGSADETALPDTRAKVLFENDQVRVLRYLFNPGDKDSMHGHPDNVQIMLTDAHATVTTPDGKTNQVEGKAGQVSWRPAVVHSVANTGDRPFEGIVVEMKGGTKSAAD
jgi:quercetin dioxygenase-like cupin family protein